MENNVNTSQTIGTTASVISVEKNNRNAPRRAIIVINTSTSSQKISLGIDKEAVSGQGIVLSAGGVWSDTAESNYLPTQKQISAISDAASGSIAIQERVGTD